MLSEKETEQMCAMVSQMERLIESRLPGYAHATWQLQRLATTTGDEWEWVVKTMLANSPAVETSAMQGSFGVHASTSGATHKGVVDEPCSIKPGDNNA
jgi:hypothetical protein